MVDPLEAVLSAGEGAGVEFKSTLADSRRIVETVAAMATTGGGVVLIGVRDDGTVIGVDLGDGELERLTQQVLAGTDPRVFVDVDRVRVRERVVLRIRVPPGDGPHLAFGRAFFRSGATTVAMTRDEYERRLLDRLRESSGYERRRLDDPVPALDRDAVTHWERLAAGTGRVDPRGDDVIARLHLGRWDAPTVGAVLLFGRHPQGPLPQAVVRARAQRGATHDTRSIEGPLCSQIDDAVAFVARNLRTRPVREGVRREEVPELPLSAVREVVANAVAHRDYRSTAPIQVWLTDDALDVWNPGHLPAPLTAAALRERHPSIPPNPFIARALYLAGYIEEWGTGTTRVIEAQRAAGNPEATFEVQDGGVRAVLPLPGRSPHGLAARAERVLGTLSGAAAFTSGEFADQAGVSKRTAIGDLTDLERRGLVRRVGSGRATRWVKVSA